MIMKHFNNQTYTKSVHCSIFSITSSSKNTTDLVSNLESGNTVSNLDNSSRAFQTRNITSSLRRRVHTETLEAHSFYRQDTCITSGRLIAQAATLMSISPSLGVGTSRVTIFITYYLFQSSSSTSGAPNVGISTHFIVAGIEEKQRIASTEWSLCRVLTETNRFIKKSGKHLLYTKSLMSFKECTNNRGNIDLLFSTQFSTVTYTTTFFFYKSKYWSSQNEWEWR